jgi:hypothetical protein
MAYTEQQLSDSLLQAHNAGDRKSAAAIADQIRSLRAQKPLAATNAAPMGASSQAPQITGLEASRGGKDRSLVQSLKAGLANTGIQGYLGVKQLFGELSPEEQDIRKISNNEANEDTLGKVANFVGDTALTWVPAAGAASKVGSVIKGAGGLARSIAALTAAGGAQGAVNTLIKPTDTREERLGQAGTDVAISAALNPAMAGAAKIVTQAFKPTADAAVSMAHGVIPNLQQGAEGKFGKFVGGLTSNMTDISERQGKELMDAYLEKVAPGVDFSKMNISDKMTKLDDLAGKSYAAALPSKVAITPSDRASLFAAVRASKPRSKSIADINEVVGGIFPQTNNTINASADTVRKYRADITSEIGRLVNKSAKSGLSGEEQDMMGALLKVKEKFDSNIRMKGATPQQLGHLDDADRVESAIARLLPFTDTSKGAREITVANLRDSFTGDTASAMRKSVTEADPIVKELIGPANRAMGDAATYSQERAMRAALWNIGKAAGIGGASAATGLGALPMLALYGTSALSQNPTAAKAMMGGNAWQKKLAEKIREHDAMSKISNAAQQAIDEYRE